MRHRQMVYFTVSLLVFLCTLVSSYPSSAQELTPQTCCTVQGPLSFHLTGFPDTFREKATAFYRLQTDQEVSVHFSASALRYVGPYQGDSSLDQVVYWINGNPHASFKPGKPYALTTEQGFHEFSIHGEVIIETITAQPAGNYAGTIYITVQPKYN